jgi:predicted GIY-YIG superfamily endonuclease
VSDIARQLAAALGNRTPPPGVRTALYRLYDSDGKLLYVGITANSAARWQHHKSQRPWWDRVTEKRLHWYPSREDAERAEAAAIRTELPRFNIAHHPAREAELDDREALRRLRWLVRRTVLAAAGHSTLIGDHIYGLQPVKGNP